MPQKLKTYFNWSSGKDAALALYYLEKDKNFHVDQLLTTINAHHNRVSMHGLRRELLEKQVEVIGIPINTVELTEEPTMEVYAEKMKKAVSELTSKGYTHSGFGDIFLEDLRAYREAQLKIFEITCVFPLWKRDTRKLIGEFLNLGFKAIVNCVNANLLDETFVGREIDQSFIDDLPSNVDPCGENGEFHTFCYDGPIFNQAVEFTIGEKVFRAYKNPNQSEEDGQEEKAGFWFCDLIVI